MNDKQPEALELVSMLEEGDVFELRVATELRRLHEVNAELVGVLSTLVGMAETFADELHHTHPCVIEAKAALRKATGDNNE